MIDLLPTALDLPPLLAATGSVRTSWPLWPAGLALLLVAGATAVTLTLRARLRARDSELAELSKKLSVMTTEHHETAQALRDSRERMGQVVDHLPLALWGIDREGRFTLVEGQLLGRLGLDAGRLIGRSFFERYGHSAQAVEHVRRCLDEGRASSFVVEDAGRFYETHCSPLHAGGRAGADGRPAQTGALGVTVDVTERHRAERERVRLADELRQSQKLQAIGQLAGGIAHDFNNLLSGILGSAQLLERRCTLDEQGKGYVKNIVQSAHRAAELPRSLLEYARKDRELTIPVDVHGVIHWVVKVLRRTIDKRIDIVEQLDACEPKTTGDPTTLHNALLNLAINARDAMPEGGQLRFTTRDAVLDEALCLTQPHLQPGAFVAIEVSDTGPGMCEEVQARVFEPFFTTKPEGEGTGLGLSTVFGCAQAHRGHVTCQSTPGEGTTFTLYLPLRRDPDSERLTAIRRRTPPPGLIRGTGRILLAEDEALSADTMAEGLRLMGYDVDVVGDGVSAVRRYREASSRYDLVILDVMMPGISGLQVLRQLSQADPDVRALLVTGQTELGEAEPPPGAPLLLRKPLELVSFSARVAEAIHGGTPSLPRR